MKSPRRSSGLLWVIDNPFLVAGAIYLLGNGIQLLLAKPANSEWEQVFVYSADVLRHGGDLYAPGINLFQLSHPYTYPPFHALLAIPFTFLPQLLSRFGWLLVQCVSLIVLWTLSWKISGGKRLTLLPETTTNEDPRQRTGDSAVLDYAKPRSWNPTEAIICILGLLAGMRYVQGAFGHQQSDILIDAFLVAGCYAWQFRGDFSAATAWGIAAAFKGPPLIMSLYLAWRGRWLAAAWMVVLALSLNLIPDLVDRAPQGIWLTQWYTRVVKPMNTQIGAWYVDVTINQSVAGAAHRFFATEWHLDGRHFVFTFKKESVPDKAQKLIVYALDAAILAVVALAMGRPFRRAGDERSAGLECAAMFIVMLLLSPMSHKTHFGILILPGFFIARMAIVGRDFLAAMCLAVCTISIGLLDHFAAPYGDLFAWFGNVTIGAAALGIACLAGIAKERSRQQNPAPAAP